MLKVFEASNINGDGPTYEVVLFMKYYYYITISTRKV